MVSRLEVNHYIVCENNENLELIFDVVAVVNSDADIIDKCQFYTKGCILGNKDDFLGGYDGHEGHKTNMSCRFLSYIDPKFLRPVYFDNLPNALESVQSGSHWAVMEFRQSIYIRRENC